MSGTEHFDNVVAYVSSIVIPILTQISKEDSDGERRDVVSRRMKAEKA